MQRLAVLVVTALALMASPAKKAVTPEAAAERVTAAVQSLAWSADGQALAFEEDEAIHVMDVAAGQRRVVVWESALEELSKSVPEPERFEWRNRRVREEKIQWFPSGGELLVSVEGDLFRVP
ncbi:MAG: hypothetical protein GY953_25865, partial [bacterium]|nr:hypothetical protein [bacterium]